MQAASGRYLTKELSPATWPDFEALFTRGNGWDFCWCMACQRAQSATSGRLTRAEKGRLNHAAKHDLVEDGQAPGVLVYDGDEAVGWCQYGPATELLAPGTRRRTPPIGPAPGPRWRVTCFVTDKRYRRQGVAGTALGAALDAIARRGGGLVEAYPVAHAHVDREYARLLRQYGRASTEVKRHPSTRERPWVLIEGAGRLESGHGSFGNVSTQGTVSMFMREGFTPIGVLRRTHVVMQRTVTPARG
jgi:GNAT superfamily N-acetyltransferase